LVCWLTNCFNVVYQYTQVLWEVGNVGSHLLFVVHDYYDVQCVALTHFIMMSNALY
jgi:hypothetical protein